MKISSIFSHQNLSDVHSLSIQAASSFAADFSISNLNNFKVSPLHFYLLVDHFSRMGSVLSGTKIINPMAQKFVQESIANQRVVIFSKSYCPYCTMAKEVSFMSWIREIPKMQSVTHQFVIHCFCFLFLVAIQEDKLSVSRCWTGGSRWL